MKVQYRSIIIEFTRKLTLMRLGKRRILQLTRIITQEAMIHLHGKHTVANYAIFSVTSYMADIEMPNKDDSKYAASN